MPAARLSTPLLILILACLATIGCRNGMTEPLGLSPDPYYRDPAGCWRDCVTGDRVRPYRTDISFPRTTTP